MTDRTALYRLYDVEGTLMYIGISGDPRQRWNAHAIDTGGCRVWPDVAAPRP